MRFRGEQQVLARARARAPAHPVLDEVGRIGRIGPRGAHELRDVGADVAADRRLADEMLEVDERGGGEHVARLPALACRGVVSMMMRSSSSALG